MHKKLKVMLVDDEYMVIEDLTKLTDWERNGCEIIGTASNGNKALEMYEKFRPDIIFVDIRMPILDGIDFSRIVLSMDRNVKILLLTAYKDFEYAMQALDIGVFSYLLKYELNEEKLLQELEKVKKVILEEDRNFRTLIQQKLIKFSSHRNLSENEISDDCKILSYHGNRFIPVTIQIDTPYPLISYEYELNNIDIHRVFDQLSIPERILMAECAELNGKLWLAVFFTNDALNKKSIWELLYPVASRLQTAIRERFGMTASIVLDSESRPVLTMPEFCQKSIQATRFCIFLGREKIFAAGDFPSLHSRDYELKSLKKDYAIFENLVVNMDIAEIKKSLENLHESMTKPYYDNNGFSWLCSKLVNLLEKKRMEYSLCSLEDMIKSESGHIECWYSVSNIFIWFEEQFERTMLEGKDNRLNGFSNLVKQACRSIHENYAKNLSVDGVADELKISGVWLSKSFKRETGITFLDYLTQFRIEKAKELLDKSDYKVYEIAEKVGYRTSQYFSRVFYRLTGLSPFEYRERRMKI